MSFKKMAGAVSLLSSQQKLALRLKEFNLPLPRDQIPYPKEVDIPHHPEILTTQHVDHAIEVYQEEFETITCNFIEIVPRTKLPKDHREIYDDSDWQLWFYKKQRYRLSELAKNYLLRQKMKEISLQKFNPKRTGALGPDLAASHFITYRGGRVKFVGSDTWIAREMDLPHRMDTAFKVEKLDASSCRVYYEGLDNFINLKQLEHLDLSDNPLDDWACGRLACHFRNSKKLKFLNLTDNKDISAVGLQSVATSIPALEKIVISGTKAADYQHLDLLIMLIQDVNPKCEIQV